MTIHKGLIWIRLEPREKLSGFVSNPTKLIFVGLLYRILKGLYSYIYTRKCSCMDRADENPNLQTLLVFLKRDQASIENVRRGRRDDVV